MASCHCCVPQCTNDSRYDPEKLLTFHRIPKDQKMNKIWIVKIRRDIGRNFKLSASTRVCSAHFQSSDFVKKLSGLRRLQSGAVPSVFAWTKEPSKRIGPQKGNRKTWKKRRGHTWIRCKRSKTSSTDHGDVAFHSTNPSLRSDETANAPRKKFIIAKRRRLRALRSFIFSNNVTDNTESREEKRSEQRKDSDMAGIGKSHTMSTDLKKICDLEAAEALIDLKSAPTASCVETPSVSKDHDYCARPTSFEEKLAEAQKEIVRLQANVDKLEGKTFFLDRFSGDPRS